MTRLRRDTHDTITAQPQAKSLRIVASGTLFLTHTLSMPNYPIPGNVVRAHTVERARGGSANLVLSMLAQFPSVEPLLVAPLSGNEEGQLILKDLEKESVNIRYCKIWKNAGVPTAWILDSAEGDGKSVINHNPLPDITHEEFVSLLGPLLAPENYPDSPLNTPPIPHYAHSPHSTSPYPGSPVPRASVSSLHPGPPPQLFNPNSPAPFDWLHFEGRSVKTTMSNMTGLDGLARERKWRSHCVFSVDVGRKGKQGVEALIPYADVLFLNRWYAEEISEHYASSPRAFLLSMTSVAPPHALLVAHWGKDGAAVLSLPTREYFQSSGWVEEQSHLEADRASRDASEMRSVRSGSDFWADGMTHTRTSSAFYSFGYTSDFGTMSSPTPYDRSHMGMRGRDEGMVASPRTTRPPPDSVVDEVGAQDAFIAGMIFALSRRLMPGAPYTPSWSGQGAEGSPPENERGRWRLDECLRFATELAGRKARRRTWEGLADEMTQAGWFEA